MKHIVIVGCGASGALLAVNLIQHCSNIPLQISIFNNSPDLANGIAYSTSHEEHLLNVRANNMSALIERKDDFHNWLLRNNIEMLATDYAKRQDYGKYLRELLEDSVNSKSDNIKINIYYDEVIDIEVNTENSAYILSGNGLRIEADYIFLAIGNFPPSNPILEDNSYVNSLNYFANSWNWGNFDDINLQNQTNKTIFILGTGLTMVDAVLTLNEKGIKSKIVALSRHGLLPAEHVPQGNYPDFSYEFQYKINLLEILNIIKKHLKLAEDSGFSPLLVIDSLRPHLQDIWINFSDNDKELFLRRLRHYWDVARHRMPPQCSKYIKYLSNTGNLEIISGNLISVREIENLLFIEYFDKKINKLEKIVSSTMINCTGPETDLSNVKNTLLSNLFKKGMITNDRFKLGLNSSVEGAIKNSKNETSNFIFTLGPTLRGVLWETVAIPEIRVQAWKLAEMVAEKEKNIN